MEFLSSHRKNRNNVDLLARTNYLVSLIRRSLIPVKSEIFHPSQQTLTCLLILGLLDTISTRTLALGYFFRIASHITSG